MELVEIDQCIYIRKEYEHSRGFEGEDRVGRESFVNHIHIEGKNHLRNADDHIQRLCTALKAGWPNARFRIYHQIDPSESTVRFHMVRESEPNWCSESGEIGGSFLRIIEVG